MPMGTGALNCELIRKRTRSVGANKCGIIYIYIPARFTIDLLLMINVDTNNN